MRKVSFAVLALGLVLAGCSSGTGTPQAHFQAGGQAICEEPSPPGPSGRAQTDLQVDQRTLSEETTSVRHQESEVRQFDQLAQQFNGQNVHGVDLLLTVTSDWAALLKSRASNLQQLHTLISDGHSSHADPLLVQNIHEQGRLIEQETSQIGSPLHSLFSSC